MGTDLMIKVLRHGRNIEMGAMVGIDAASDGLARASRMGVVTSAEGTKACSCCSPSTTSNWYLMRRRRLLTTSTPGIGRTWRFDD